MKKWYLKLDSNNVILDAIEYPVEGYTEVDLETTHLPAGINGGWWKFENGKTIELPELKPIDEATEIENLKQLVADLTELVLGGI